MIHNSPIASIEYKKIRGDPVVFFKMKKFYSGVLHEEYLNLLQEDILKFYKEQHSKKIKFMQIYDLTLVEISSVYNDLAFVKEYCNFLQSNVEYIMKESCIGTSIVINSYIVKNIANATMLLYRHVSPTRVHTDITESYEWLGLL